MQLFNYYYKKTIKYDLINKFFYKKLKNIPKLKKIILNFGCNNFDYKILATTLLALELVTNNRGHLTNSKRPNILLKIRKGYPVGCSLILTKKEAYNFFFKLINQIFPKLKDFNGILVNKKQKKTSFSFSVKELIAFNELEVYFYLFNNLPILNITLLTNSKTQKELIYFLKALKFPLI